MKPVLNLFIIGAAKCGTTTVWEYLNQFPDVSMGREKEPCIFSFSNWRSRLGLFIEDYDPEKKWRGEASTVYSETHVTPETPKRIFEYNPEARIIYIVRNPFDRMLSVWKQTLSTGHHLRGAYRDKTDDADIPRMPRRLKKAVWTYPPFLGACQYFKHYSTYTSVFPEEQILLLFYEDLKFQPEHFYNQVREFLSLHPMREADTGIWKNPGEGKRVKNSVFWSELSGRLRLKSFLQNHPRLHNALSRMLQPCINPRTRLKSQELQKINTFLAKDMSNILHAGGKPPEFWGRNGLVAASGGPS